MPSLVDLIPSSMQRAGLGSMNEKGRAGLEIGREGGREGGKEGGKGGWGEGYTYILNLQ